MAIPITARSASGTREPIASVPADAATSSRSTRTAACSMMKNKAVMIACAVTYGRMPDLSVVIPTFNTASMTLRCCRAVLASMPQGTEVIVVDDGSSDGTAEMLGRDGSGVQVGRLDSNRGFAPAANAGVGAAH